jgi:large subunit ribosomal protein L32
VAVPKRRKSASKRDKRRANHDKIEPVQVITCDNCGDISLPHRACRSCGFYKGRQVMAVKEAGA